MRRKPGVFTSWGDVGWVAGWYLVGVLSLTLCVRAVMR